MESSICSKIWTKTCCILVKMNSFVLFLEEFSAWQFTFNFNWPLGLSKICYGQFLHLRYFRSKVRKFRILLERSIHKVQIFWEGHKFLQNLHCRFVLCSKSQIYSGDFANFCGLLRIYELYQRGTWLCNQDFFNMHVCALGHSFKMTWWSQIMIAFL